MEFSIPLQPGSPLGRQIFEGVRHAIRSGRLRAGDRLPSTRDLAEQWGVSRSVVVTAFEQLQAEGYIATRRGSGCFVSPEVAVKKPERPAAAIDLSRYGRHLSGAPSAGFVFPATRPGRRYDFAYGRGDVADFPFARWRRLLTKHARQASARELDYGPAAGHPSLREAICTHVRRSRGVSCEPSQVIVVNGSQQAIDLVARVLVDPGDAVAIENPHYQGTRAILAASGARLCPVDVDEAGLDPSNLPPSARALFLTPSHQFPTGGVLTMARRLAILDWANRCGAVVVEDDYDGEFRYDGQPLESLQGLDGGGRVIYVGTFSRTVFAALRIGYLIVPKALVGVFEAAKWLADRHTAGLEQRVLAEFIDSGSYELHLRRVRRSLATRRDALLDAMATAWGSTLRATGEGAGAHVVLWLPTGSDERRAIDTAASHDVGVYPVSGYFLRHARPGLLLGFAQMTLPDIREGIRRLAASLSSI